MREVIECYLVALARAEHVLPLIVNRICWGDEAKSMFFSFFVLLLRLR